MLTFTDRDGDTLLVEPAYDPSDGQVYLLTSSRGAYLSTKDARELRDYLDEHLGETREPVTLGTLTGDGEDLDADYHVEVGGQRLTGAQWEAARTAFLGTSAETVGAEEPLAEWERELQDACADTQPAPTVLEDAQHAVYGDRQQDYGHPREDFTRTAILWTGLLHHKLVDGTYLEPEDIARCMIAVKLARDVHAPKRDNRVDMAGYALTLDRLETGQ